MKKKVLCVATVLVLAAFVFAEITPAPCPARRRVDPSAVDFVEVDVNQCPGGIIRALQYEAGGDYGEELSVCDPDNDPVVWDINLPAGATFDPNTQYFYSAPDASQIGTHYIYVKVTDVPSAILTARSDEGTMVIDVVRRNEAPVLLLPF